MKTIYFYLFLLCTSLTFAQQQVSGTVKDASGVPLPGVNITETGTTNGTTSDFDGNYKITLKSSNTLTFSYVGYNTNVVIAPQLVMAGKKPQAKPFITLKGKTD
ncbi:carboxypeptidase-like regulatory domain-containing protein [Algibacter pectinivorans]|uniref:CarboxypepD_reg-like domain-containing protein n=1 Tax=Algibacter pectinivorans TaxID=870482 RepID=A0A1I1QR25_9FLAO|nr:CarboxypepD_reg-like domain-containing protein [Algibacter pectinivorans]